MSRKTFALDVARNELREIVAEMKADHARGKAIDWNTLSGAPEFVGRTLGSLEHWQVRLTAIAEMIGPTKAKKEKGTEP